MHFIFSGWTQILYCKWWDHDIALCALWTQTHSEFATFTISPEMFLKCWCNVSNLRGRSGSSHHKIPNDVEDVTIVFSLRWKKEQRTVVFVRLNECSYTRMFSKKFFKKSAGLRKSERFGGFFSLQESSRVKAVLIIAKKINLVIEKGQDCTNCILHKR